jgi:KDO2-lipid IV(A) lauroyltransferase
MAHRVEHGLFRLTRAVLDLLPERLALALGSGLGFLTGVVFRVRRSDVDRHLAWAFPERPARWRRRVARDSYMHLGREAVVLFRRGGWSPDEIVRRTRVVGFEDLRLAAAGPSGVVLLTGHLGNWEMGGAAVAARGLPIDVVAKGMANRRFEQDLWAARARLGMSVIEMGDAPRGVLRSLGHERVAAMLGDQNAHRNGTFVPFFGRLAATPRGPAVFALRTGAPVFMGIATRDPGREPVYTVRFEPLDFDPSGDPESDVGRFTARYMEVLEEAVRRAPEQYFWQHRRWNTRPAEEPPGTP